MDFRNSADLSDNNTILYGHHMKDSSMFGSLQEYRSQDYYNSHKEAYYFTPDKAYVIEPVFGYTTSEKDKIYELERIDERVIAEMRKKSNFKADVEVSEADKFLTLSTCAYEQEGARYIVIGALRALN